MGRVDMSGNFTVIEGRNSSGKTSLAEALEWLYTGSLSRRDSTNSGNSREFEQCVTNQFRPADGDTWVKAEFVKSSGNNNINEILLCRVLKEGYGAARNATCSSGLFLDDRELTPAAEKQILDELFAGVPPLLMQHTLRDFVQGDPKRRREYFESLLRLDDLTELIRQAVVTDDRATGFPSPNGDAYRRQWDELGSMLEHEVSQKAHGRISHRDEGDPSERISAALSVISRAEFPSILDGLSQNDEILAALQREQMRVRQNSFPILARLRPRSQLSDSSQEPMGSTNVETLSQKIRDSWKDYEPKLLALQAIHDENLAVSRAFKLLVDAGVIRHGKDSQSCPLCAYEYVDTLSPGRVATIESWNPILQSERTGRLALERAMNSLVDLKRRDF